MHGEGLLPANFWLVTLLISEQWSQFGKYRHPGAPGVAADHYVSTSCCLLLAYPFHELLLMKAPT